MPDAELQVDWMIFCKRWKQVESDATPTEHEVVNAIAQYPKMARVDIDAAYSVLNAVKRRTSRQRFYEDTGSFDGCPVK